MLFQLAAFLFAGLSGILFFFSRHVRAAMARVKRLFRRPLNDSAVDLSDRVQESEASKTSGSSS
jgi:hypothetical protein